MINSNIEWTDATANPWWGCVKVSPGCTNCYAETLSKRTGRNIWGPAKTTDRQRMVKIWRDVPEWNKQKWAHCAGCGWRGELLRGHVCPACASNGLTSVLEPARMRVFTASMADIFEDHPQVAPWRAEWLELMAACKNIDWQVLTKRPENVQRFVPPAWLEDWPAHIWMGVSVEDQERANERVPALLEFPAPVRFLSCEPLLGPVDFRKVPGFNRSGSAGIDALRGLWVIVGGESGPNARPMNPRWVEDLQGQTAGAGVPFFFKQWGEWAPNCECPTKRSHKTIDRPGGGGVMFRCGKQAAGHELRGMVHQEWPKTPEART